MDIYKLPELLSITNFPVALGGCRSDGTNFDCCEYNVTVLDDTTGESIQEIEGNLVKVHHCSLSESKVDILHQLQDIKILCDDQWKLKMLLSSLKEKKKQIANSFAKNCLVDAGILANKAKNSATTNDPFAGVWIKCAAYFLADSVLCLDLRRPSPTHMLEVMRSMKTSKVDQIFSVIHQILGIERSSTSLLSRMVKSTAGLSDLIECNGNFQIILRKYEYLVENSLLSDCYFYLGYLNRNNILKIKNQIHRNQDYIHILKVGLDIEGDPIVIERQASVLLELINKLLGNK